jgi:hypothetical protein
MAKRKKGQTTRWPKEKKDRQHDSQKKKRTDNTMAKRKKGQTTQWPKEKKDRQHDSQKKKRTDNTMAKLVSCEKPNSQHLAIYIFYMHILNVILDFFF